MLPLAPAMILAGPPVIPVPAETTVITHSRRTPGRPGAVPGQNSGSLPAAGPRGRRRVAGRAGGLERGLDGVGDKLRGLRVDDDVPAEQHAADDLPGVPGRVLRVGSHLSPPC